MNTITIAITYDSKQKLLIFNDGKNIGIDITTVVQKGDFVIWKPAAFSDLSSLDNIIDSSKVNVFYPGPKKNADGSWQGTVTAAAGTSESYFVLYTVKGLLKIQDPKIQVH